ncbi:MAG: hypothetical protein QM767_14195 [Anaeromyxobacter sp.]
MKKLILSLAALAVAVPAAAQSKASTRTTLCAEYEGSWRSEDLAKEPWQEKATTVCKEGEDDEWTCVIHLPTDEAWLFEGGSRGREGQGHYVEAYDEDKGLTLQLVCRDGALKDCIGIRVFNEEQKKGMQCLDESAVSEEEEE